MNNSKRLIPIYAIYFSILVPLDHQMLTHIMAIHKAMNKMPSAQSEEK